jgi:photosystem II stability/assembly factor-like uncharacterized protein
VLTAQVSGTTQRLQAVSPVSDQVVWASGTGGTYVRTTDGGATWQAAVVPGADSLEFRDVQGIDSSVAYLLSSGPGARSRIYKTADAGRTWSLQFTSSDSAAFYDCLSFWDADHGLAMSDGVNGHFPVLLTEDGGGRWTPVPEADLPAAQPGEGAFAASGTCVVTAGRRSAWIGTGASTGGGRARVLHSDDRGLHWTVAETPLLHGTSTTGITSLTFRDVVHGAAMGGDIAGNEPQRDNVAITSDGGRTWTLAGHPTFKGAIFGGAWVPRAAATLVAVGPGGSSYSANGGVTWQPMDLQNYWSVGFSNGGIGWMVGPAGRITRVSFRQL